MTIWAVPEEEGITFEPIMTYRAHNAGINRIVSTYRNLISIGDDEVILFTDLTSLLRVRKLDVRQWAIYKNLLYPPDIPR